jgi:hypothetical protein
MFHSCCNHVPKSSPSQGVPATAQRKSRISQAFIVLFCHVDARPQRNLHALLMRPALCLFQIDGVGPSSWSRCPTLMSSLFRNFPQLLTMGGWLECCFG